MACLQVQECQNPPGLVKTCRTSPRRARGRFRGLSGASKRIFTPKAHRKTPLSRNRQSVTKLKSSCIIFMFYMLLWIFLHFHNEKVSFVTACRPPALCLLYIAKRCQCLINTLARNARGQFRGLSEASKRIFTPKAHWKPLLPRNVWWIPRFTTNERWKQRVKKKSTSLQMH